MPYGFKGHCYLSYKNGMIKDVKITGKNHKGATI